MNITKETKRLIETMRKITIKRPIVNSCIL